MKFEHLQGSIVAMVTPFRQDGSVNFDMLTELLERQIAGAGVQEQVILLGARENPYPYIRGCDLLVQPSRYEGLHCHPDREEPAVPVHGGGCPAADLPLLQQG